MDATQEITKRISITVRPKSVEPGSERWKRRVLNFIFMHKKAKSVSAKNQTESRWNVYKSAQTLSHLPFPW